MPSILENPARQTSARQTSARQRVVLAAQQALNSIDIEVYWDTVMNDVAPKAEANERIRARSLAKAGHHVLR